MSPLVSIIIVNYNGARYVGACLESVLKLDYPNYEVIVVDNCSTDQSAEVIQRYPVTYWPLSVNGGFAVGNNAGWKIAQGEYIALLNPDTVVTTNWLSELVKTLETDLQIAQVGGKIYLGESAFLDSAGSIYTNALVAWSRGVFAHDDGQYEQIEEVPMVTACATLLRRTALASTELFDPDFFMYMEEVDLALRLRNLGYKIVYTPHAVIRHYQSQSVLQQAIPSLIFKQYHANINLAKMLGQYFIAADYWRVGYILCFFYAYYFFYFIGHGYWRLAGQMVTKSIQYWGRGRRARSTLTLNRRWSSWAEHLGIGGYLRFKKQLTRNIERYRAETCPPRH